MARDYDPVKAHEYYMKTRQLKGRRSTKGLTKNARKMLSYVKSQLEAEHKERMAAIKEQVERNRELLRGQLKGALEALREQIKNLPKGDTGAKDALREKMQGMRQLFSSAQKGITEKAKGDRAASRGQRDSEYEAEIEKLKKK